MTQNKRIWAAYSHVLCARWDELNKSQWDAWNLQRPRWGLSGRESVLGCWQPGAGAPIANPLKTCLFSLKGSGSVPLHFWWTWGDGEGKLVHISTFNSNGTLSKASWTVYLPSALTSWGQFLYTSQHQKHSSLWAERSLLLYHRTPHPPDLSSPAHLPLCFFLHGRYDRNLTYLCFFFHDREKSWLRQI